MENEKNRQRKRERGCAVEGKRLLLLGSGSLLNQPSRSIQVWDDPSACVSLQNNRRTCCVLSPLYRWERSSLARLARSSISLSARATAASSRAVVADDATAGSDDACGDGEGVDDTRLAVEVVAVVLAITKIEIRQRKCSKVIKILVKSGKGAREQPASRSSWVVALGSTVVGLSERAKQPADENVHKFVSTIKHATSGSTATARKIFVPRCQ